MRIIQSLALFLIDSMGRDDALQVGTAASSCVLVLVNLWYLPYLLRRPYISHRPSKKYGDPLNDAELFTTRTISWSAALLALRAGAARSLRIDNLRWTMDVFCGLVLLGLVYSQFPLFYGLNTVLVSRLSSSLSIQRSGEKGISREQEEASESELKGGKVPGRPKVRPDVRLSGAQELGSGSQIQGMLEATSYRKVIYMQIRLRPLGMPKDERSRWASSPEEAEGQRRWHCRLLGRSFFFSLAFLGLAAGILLLRIFYRRISGNASEGLSWAFVWLPTLLCLVLEYMTWKARRSRCGSGEGENPNTASNPNNASTGSSVGVELALRTGATNPMV